jgi:Zn-dependent membrane protease YugP
MHTALAYFYISPGLFWTLFIFVFMFSIYAQIRVSSAYAKNSRILSRGGITGREAASAVMARAGITDVAVEETNGYLSDHYDPVHKTLVLSSENYRGSSLAAVGVAAHEAGHALQHREGYKMLEFRMALLPATRIAAGVVPFIYLASFVFLRGLSGTVLDIAIVCFAVLTLFHLVTLPVEFDASRRAKVQLVSLGILDRDEMPRGERDAQRRRAHLPRRVRGLAPYAPPAAIVAPQLGVDHGAKLGRQRLQGERLLQESGEAEALDLARRLLPAQPAHQDDADIRPQVPQPCEDLPSVHPRQHEVEKHEGVAPGIGRELR